MTELQTTEPPKLLPIQDSNFNARNVEEDFRRLRLWAESVGVDLFALVVKGHYEEKFTATATKTITHNLSARPQVIVYDSADREISVLVDYVDANSIKLTFSGTLTDATVVVTVGDL